jgi:hypothetical protein
MAQQKIVWTVLPHGRVEKGTFAGRLRVSIIASPRLTPQAAAEQVLTAFPEWVNWPMTLAKVKFRLRIGTQLADLQPESQSDPDLWARLLGPGTPVAGFVFKNMSQVNLRSYAVRNVLGLMRKHYGTLAVQSASTHPTLLPWKNAHPNLKGMLTELGTRTHIFTFGQQQVEVMLPGFDRFFDDDNKEGVETRLRALVFGKDSKYFAPAAGIGVDRAGNPQAGPNFQVRVLPPDWNDPAGGGPDAPVMSQFTSAAEYTLYQANRFYRREPPTDAQLKMRRPALQNVPLPPKAPEYDFHRIVASYSDYPALLRALGLVIDCVLPPGSPIDQQVAAAGQAQGVIALELAWAAGHNTGDDHCPQTAWRADKERFTTRERTIDHQRGMLRLQFADDRWGVEKKQSSLFDVYQVDPDGAALKTVDFLLSAQNLVGKSLKLGADGEVTYSTGDKQPVAALRSGGLGVTRHGRAAVIAQSAASAALKNQAIQSGPATAKNIVLFAEDVLRGYRVDAQALPGGVAQKWHSLCRRHGTYRFAGSGQTIGLPDDEGYVKGASTTSAADPAVDPDDHYLHESMFRWTGWSLVVPRPGRTMRSRTDPGSGVQGESPEDVTDEHVAGGNGLAVTFAAAKGSLPRLRFGTPYRLRARIVDLAGNSLSHEDGSLEKDPNASQPVTYWRFETVDPPAMLHRSRTSEGESLERMVIRSNWNADPAAYLGTPELAAAIALPASADFEYNAVNERHLVPPKSSQLQCEQHGMFDALFANPASIKQAYEVAARESGTLYDALPSSQIELITPASLQDVATTKTVPLKLPSTDNPVGDRIAPGQYVIHREAQVATPYLPDPAAGGVALRAMPGHALPGVTGPMVLGPSAAVIQIPNDQPVLVIAHAKDWPDSVGLRIVLAERKAALADPPCSETFADDGAPKWDEDARVLTLFVAKGRVVRLRYASFVHKAFIGAFGLPDWVNSAGEQAFVRAMAGLGCTWMVTPYRALTLVHATQQPVCEPTFLSLTPTRQIGDQHAMLVARLQLHGPSTGKFEVEADWDEWVDDLDKSGPELIPSRGQLGEVLLAENHINVFSLSSAVVAQMHDPANRPRARGDRHELGDTKFRLIRYRIRGTTRFREYLPEALYAKLDAVTRLGPIGEGPAMKVGAPDDPGAPVLPVGTGFAPDSVVPATAPPDEPRPLYAVPTFRWLETPGTGSLDSTRLGNGLRVWLERPWFSSGNGELLGVVILGENRPFTDVGSALVPLVTQWGLDPIWDTTLPKYRTRVSDFPARVADEQVGLREIEGQIVHVVGHRVHWDSVRSLWYCDIELDAGRTYMPFVRVALVRYQPNALAAAKISKVVLGEFAQVLPRRRATFNRKGAQLDFALRGDVPAHGPMKFPIDSEYQDISVPPPLGTGGETGRNKVELVLQTRDPALDTDLAWSDVKVLASSVVAPVSGGLAVAEVGSAPLVAQPVRRAASARASVRDRLGSRVDLGTAVNLGTVGSNVTTAIGGVSGPAIINLIDPVIWKSTVALPDTGGKPARVVVREYERYYTDRSVPGRVGTTTHRRRVVEERLVYTAFFDL